MAVRNTVMAIPYKTRAAATFNGTFQNIGTPLEEPCFMIRVVNESDTDVQISYDGINPNDYVITKTQVTLNFQTNGQPNNYLANLPKGMQIYVRGLAGNGNVFLIGYFQHKA